ncbi:hypothetical protein [Pseudomonas sp. M30-35]|uniref:hypothetical protein n=1 Tax=Pseudomonas sp. M30-35 TaxID=1981174 RepID=UPI0012FD01D1|nr:hypothetical protein [Pseudomonas sp. M30-35]
MIAGTEAVVCPVPVAASLDEIAEVKGQQSSGRNPFVPVELECKYLNPPKHLMLIESSATVSECQANKHNLNAMKSGCPYYVSEGDGGEGPEWCIQDGPASNELIDMFTLLTNATCDE